MVALLHHGRKIETATSGKASPATVMEVSLGFLWHLKDLKGISHLLSNLTNMMHLNLSYNSLSGGLPPELLFSGSISVLDNVSFNRLGGSLQDLSSLTVSEKPLQVLNISSNLFKGEFPSVTWEKTRSLVALNASNNSFQGQIPSSFCITSPSFQVLDLSHNQFSGDIPTGLGNCSTLKVLKVGHNKLSGTLPNELFNATSLEHLSLNNNALQGMLDGALIPQLINLATLDLEGNNLSGKIPDYIGQLKKLEVLHLGWNKMYGELPSALGSCIHLTTINLKGNSFSGHIEKVNFSSLSNLRTLDLYTNNFSGTIPESIYSCSSLTALRLSANHFHRELSTKIGGLKYLSFLSLGYNSFTNITSAIQILNFCKNLTILLSNFKGEVIPQDEIIEGFGNLQVFAIEECMLSDEIPLWLSKLTNLEVLVLHGNRLTGPIPSWINSLSHLFYLDVSSNLLTREIPVALMTMPMIKSFDSAPYLDTRPIYLSVYRDPSHEYGSFTSSPKLVCFPSPATPEAERQTNQKLKRMIATAVFDDNLVEEWSSKWT
ncbi:hypothetical protein PR202_ga06499 [Eleusine coracana subsp. coracana]|uniref:Uncharacterized protein n=1 Tax=Eleusine coracana subsp. coracana TaxID=191504 RepID=A0AAV5BV26_ELECO|nr:hypothetical protein PR202_ga06499 [Eleusine coracana subsp. coracana]